MPTMRAKMSVTSVQRFAANNEIVQFNAVSSGTPEDNTYSKYTPSASVSITITNPTLLDKFIPGCTYYVDFTPTV